MLFSHGKKEETAKNVIVPCVPISDSKTHRKTHVHHITRRQLQDYSTGHTLKFIPGNQGMVQKNSLVVLVQCYTHVLASPVIHGIESEEIDASDRGCEETCVGVQRNRQRAEQNLPFIIF